MHDTNDTDMMDKDMLNVDTLDVDMMDVETDLEIGVHLRDTLAVAGWQRPSGSSLTGFLKLNSSARLPENTEIQSEFKIFSFTKQN